MKYLHGSALFLGVVAALYSTRNVWKDEDYQKQIVEFTKEDAKKARFAAKKAKTEAAKSKK